MFLEEFRSVAVLGSSLAASTGLFTCFFAIPTGPLDTGPINIKLIINPEASEEIKEPEPKPEEVEPVVEEKKEEEVIPEPEPVKVTTPEPTVPPKPPAPPKPNRTKRRIPVKKSNRKNYKSKKRDHRDVFHVKPTKGEAYWLYRPHTPLNFSFNFRNPNVDFPELSAENMRIRLFKRSAWEDINLWEDEYGDPLTPDQIKELFQDQDPKKTKQLLFSLSVKRNWRKYAKDHYDSDRPNLIYWKPWDASRLNIKYFREFSEFKEYVLAKVDNCKDDVPCVADRKELDILPQDEVTFFNDN